MIGAIIFGIAMMLLKNKFHTKYPIRTIYKSGEKFLHELDFINVNMYTYVNNSDGSVPVLCLHF